MNKVKWKIRPGWLVGYCITLALYIFCIIFFRNFFFLAFLVATLGMAVISVVMLFYSSRRLTFFLESAESEKQIDEEVLLRIIFINSSVWPIMRVTAEMEIKNFFSGKINTTEIATPVTLRGRSSMNIPLTIRELGSYAVSCKRLKSADLFNLIEVSIPCVGNCSFFALPKSDEESEVSANAYAGIMTEVTESNQVGSDFSETVGIREYRDGDRLRDIHWKATAKAREIMVKERQSMSGSELCCVILPVEDFSETETIVTALYELLESAIKQRMPVRIIYWNADVSMFDDYLVVDKRTRTDFFTSFYKSEYKLRITDNMKLYVSRWFPNINTYLMISLKEGKIQWEVVTND